MAEEILIKDTENVLWRLPAFVRKLFVRAYHVQGFIYVEKHWTGDRPTHCSADMVKWLDRLKIETYSEKRANRLAWRFFREKYPEYDHYVQLF